MAADGALVPLDQTAAARRSLVDVPHSTQGRFRHGIVRVDIAIARSGRSTTSTRPILVRN